MSEVVSLHQVAETTGIAVTPTTRDIHATLRICESGHFLGAVVGAPGTGKTTAIEAYAAASEGVKICRMNRATSALQAMLGRICQSLDLDAPSCAGAARLLNLATEAVFGGQPLRSDISLLIIDEAQYLDDAALEGVRDLYDAIRDLCGVVLVGNDSLPARWADSKKSSHLFRQLSARMLQPHVLGAPDADDLRALCAHYAINAKESRALIERAASRPGRLHNVERLLCMARQLASDGAPTAQHFRDAARLTGVSQ